jgi:hypothetical protein
MQLSRKLSSVITVRVLPISLHIGPVSSRYEFIHATVARGVYAHENTWSHPTSGLALAINPDYNRDLEF